MSVRFTGITASLRRLAAAVCTTLLTGELGPLLGQTGATVEGLTVSSLSSVGTYYWSEDLGFTGAIFSNVYPIDWVGERIFEFEISTYTTGETVGFGLINEDTSFTKNFRYNSSDGGWTDSNGSFTAGAQTARAAIGVVDDGTLNYYLDGTLASSEPLVAAGENILIYGYSTGAFEATLYIDGTNFTGSYAGAADWCGNAL